MSEQEPSLVAMRDEREETITRLTDAFAADLIDVDEFEERVDKAHQASDIETLVSLRSDVSAPPDSGPEVHRTALQPVSKDVQEALVRAQPKAKWVLAILSGAERKGQWRVPKKLRVTTLMGGAVIDFREAIMTPGLTEISVMALMGGIEVIVPPTLAVECEGWGIAGTFESLDRFPVVADPERPFLRIKGMAVAGAVEISTRLPGESKRQANKRRKRERKDRQQALAGKTPNRLGK